MESVRQKNGCPLIIAHRGSSNSAPENTIAAFRKARNVSDGIEFDVRISSDGDPVVFHDSTLKRVAGEPIKVDSLTTRELADVDVGGWFNRNNPEFASREYINEGVPTLESTLSYLKDFGGPIYVELKASLRTLKRLSEAAGEILREFNQKGNLIVKSFEFDTIPLVRRICPDIDAAALFAPNIMRILRKEKRLLCIAEDIGANCLSLHYSLATKKLMSKALERSMPVAVWTTDTPKWIGKARKLGISAIITNNPETQFAFRENLLATS